jgi:hypothetical protein
MEISNRDSNAPSLAIKIIDAPTEKHDDAPHTAIDHASRLSTSEYSPDAKTATGTHPRSSKESKKSVSMAPELQKILADKIVDKDSDDSSPRSSTIRKSTSYQGDKARLAALLKRDDDTRRLSVISAHQDPRRLSFGEAGTKSSSNGGSPRQDRKMSTAYSVLSQKSVTSQRSNFSHKSSRPAIKMYPKPEVVIVNDQFRYASDPDSIFQTEASPDRENFDEEINDDEIIDEGQFANKQEYFEYLMLSQRRNSTTYMQSTEIVYNTEKSMCKFIGPYLLGDVIGKGAL